MVTMNDANVDNKINNVDDDVDKGDNVASIVMMMMIIIIMPFYDNVYHSQLMYCARTAPIIRLLSFI